MTLLPRLVRASSAACLLACLVLGYGTSSADTARADELIRGQPACFVPNLGQWDHPAKFVHRNGPMVLFLEDRGWVIDLVEHPVEPETNPGEPGHHSMLGDGRADQKIRGVALRMAFEGDTCVPEIVGEEQLSGHHNYFLGNDESRWRTGVPLYSSVRYEDLYPGIDLRLRAVSSPDLGGWPEYDLLLSPGADLDAVAQRRGKGRPYAECGGMADDLRAGGHGLFGCAVAAAVIDHQYTRGGDPGDVAWNASDDVRDGPLLVQGRDGHEQLKPSSRLGSESALCRGRHGGRVYPRESQRLPEVRGQKFMGRATRSRW